jgi:hypothetical protein
MLGSSSVLYSSLCHNSSTCCRLQSGKKYPQWIISYTEYVKSWIRALNYSGQFLSRNRYASWISNCGCGRGLCKDPYYHAYLSIATVLHLIFVLSSDGEEIKCVWNRLDVVQNGIMRSAHKKLSRKKEPTWKT